MDLDLQSGFAQKGLTLSDGGQPCKGEPTERKADAVSTISTMEAVIAVATMAALAAVPMTTAFFDWFPVTLLEVHDIMSLRASLVVEHLPTGIMQFRTLFCCWIAFSLLRFHRAQARFYRWFSSASISPAKTRGFGYFGCRAFGIFRPPVLSQSQFHLTCFLMAICLGLAALPFKDVQVTRICLFGALVMYVLYFSQLFCESRAAGHGTIIIPLVLIHLICAGNAGNWPIFLLKIHIASCYFSAGYGKLVVGCKYRKFWGNGKAQQYLFFESMWSRPGGKISQLLQGFAFRRLWLCSFMSCFTLVFQVSVPLSVLDLRLSWLFFVLSFGFHAGILVTTNISFMPYWVPALLIFLFPHGETPFDGAWDSATFALTGAYESNPIGFTCVCLYLLVQTIATLGLVDLTYGDILPISCEPMFVLPRSLHDPWPKLLVMSSANNREAGHLEPYVYSSFNPISKQFPMSKECIEKLPSKALIFTTLSSIPEEIVCIVHEDIKPTPYFVWSNVVVDDKFQQMLGEIAEILNDEENPAYTDIAKLEKLLKLQRQCSKAFQNACLQEPGTQGSSSFESGRLLLQEKESVSTL